MRVDRSRSHPLDRRELVAIFAGGMLGALGRVALARALPHGTGAWPWATLAANLAGALLLGWTIAHLPQESYGRPFLGIGVCGALTTFATVQLELLRLLDGNHVALALAYAAVSLAGGLAAVRTGIALGSRRRDRVAA